MRFFTKKSKYSPEPISRSFKDMWSDWQKRFSKNKTDLKKTIEEISCTDSYFDHAKVPAILAKYRHDFLAIAQLSKALEENRNFFKKNNQ